MVNNLFISLVLFSIAVGYCLAGTQASAWTVFVFSFAAVIGLQAGWLLTLISGANHG